jgi:hypothetical protein
MEVNTKSLDVVIGLEKSMKLPLDSLRLYLSQCIRKCDTEANTYVRNRLVRLVRFSRKETAGCLLYGY